MTDSECNVYVDVCGHVVTMIERGMEVVDGMTLREVVLVIEDTGVLAIKYASLICDLYME